LIDQEKIHNQCLSEDPTECIKAIEQLRDNFSLLSNKEQAWNDLIKLIMGENHSVRYWITSALHFISFVPVKETDDVRKTDTDARKIAASFLGYVFSDMQDKQKAWNDLHKLTNNKHWIIRYSVASAFGSAFFHMPDKQKAWSDLHKLANDENRWVKAQAASTISSVFSDVPDKQQAWNDLFRLINDNDVNIISDISLESAASALSSAFSYMPDKQQASDDLHRLTNDEDSYVRSKAARVLISVFSVMPDKQQAWNDLLRLTSDEDSSVRSKAASALGFAFTDVPDKQQAWNDLHKLTSDEDSSVRHRAASALGSAFTDVPDKQQAWIDLLRLTNDKDSSVRSKAASAIGSAFTDVPDKQQAWNDLHKLTSDEDSSVRHRAASALGSVFTDVPDKQQAWNDLYKLTTDEDSSVRSKAASAIGSTFTDVPDKQQAWNDLYKLTTDEYSLVRVSANHSLGKVSIFKASQAEKDEDYKRELETAIEFFEKAAMESKYFNPSQFCLPFYRSFHTIVFKRKEAKEEVDKYLVEARNAVKGSKSKKMLFEAVNNLANALKEVQSLDNLDLEAKKGELNFYRQYCDRAVELMKDTEKTAPFATTAMKKGLPILDRNLKELLEEIQKKAKTACKEAKGTVTEEIACAVSKEVQKWEIGSQEEMTQNIEDLIETFRMRMPHLSGYEHIFEEIEGIRDVSDLAKQYKIVSRLVGLIPIFNSMPDHVVQDIKTIKKETTSISNEIKYLQLSVDRLIESVDELQNPQEYLDTIQRTLEEIKNEIPEMEGKIDEVLYELYSPLSTTQKLKVAIPIIPSLVSYELETDVPRFVADRIDELKNLVLRFKKNK
jgi:FOG: HEAT repeat